jgi:hypothetical protein
LDSLNKVSPEVAHNGNQRETSHAKPPKAMRQAPILPILMQNVTQAALTWILSRWVGQFPDPEAQPEHPKRHELNIGETDRRKDQAGHTG